MEASYDSGVKLVFKYVYKVFPKVDRELNRWRSLSKDASDKVLGAQALASIKFKRFHAQGGSVYALYPKVNLHAAIKFIVSFQTISDYLDNLCDRQGIYDEASFRQLHLSLMDAIDPNRDMNDYYLLYPYKFDNQYLKELVQECRKQISKLPSYPLVIDYMKKYVKLYSDLQSLKHLKHNTREKRLIDWANMHLPEYSDISCWEFSAATGSTLGIFTLFAAASDPNLTKEEVAAIDSAYFPWVSGLHILLDYYIDLQEDLQSGDLNFTYYYDNLKQCEARIGYFIQRSFEHCSQLRYPGFHMTVIKGLLAMYLSDPKALTGLNRLASHNLTCVGGSKTRLYHNVCKLLRFSGKL